MNTKYIALASAALLLVGASCSETYDIYPEEYTKVLRFKNGGAQHFTVYSPHDVTAYPITIQKGGTDPSTTATAKVRVMSETEFNEWLLESGAGYSYIPSSCYSLAAEGSAQELTVNFNPKQGYEQVSVNLFPPQIGDYLEDLEDPSRTPVIPLILESPDGSIDAESSELFIIPEYSEPSVGFLNGGLQVLPDGSDTYQLKVGLPFTSEWDINCKVEVDPQVLEEYNAANSTSFGLMPEGSYSGVKEVSIAKGDDFATLDLKLDLDKALFRNALPLKITQLDMDGFTISETPAVIAIDNASKYKINLTVNDINSNDVNGSDGGGLAALVDGDLNTYCHGNYHTRTLSEPFGSWIQVFLPEEVSQVALDITTRGSYNNGHIKRVQLMANGGNGWEVFSDCSAYGDILTDRGVTGSFGSFQAPFKFKSFVLRVYEADGGELTGSTRAFWSMGEMVVYAK